MSKHYTLNKTYGTPTYTESWGLWKIDFLKYLFLAMLKSSAGTKAFVAMLKSNAHTEAKTRIENLFFQLNPNINPNRKLNMSKTLHKK